MRSAPVIAAPSRGDRDPAHRDVEAVRQEIVEQLDPHGGHEFDSHPERLAEIVRHLDIGALVRTVRLLEAERSVVAGGADPQHSGAPDAVEGRRAGTVSELHQ